MQVVVVEHQVQLLPQEVLVVVEQEPQEVLVHLVLQTLVAVVVVDMLMQIHLVLAVAVS